MPPGPSKFELTEQERLKLKVEVYTDANKEMTRFTQRWFDEEGAQQLNQFFQKLNRRQKETVLRFVRAGYLTKLRALKYFFVVD